jgi:hypothetical protein
MKADFERRCGRPLKASMHELSKQLEKFNTYAKTQREDGNQQQQ